MTAEKIFCRIFSFNFPATGERISEAEIAADAAKK
jgi:hypothetical protein